MTARPIFILSRRAGRDGFSLIEAAIVLAIIGLVIGGIWVAASAMSENFKQRQTMAGIIHLITRTQQTITLTAGAQMGCCPNITPTMAAVAGIPAGWSLNAAQNQFITPFGWVVDAASFGNRFDFIFAHLSQKQCIRLISAITAGMKKNSQIIQGIAVYTNSYGGPQTLSANSSTFPLIPTTSQCIDGLNVINLITGYTVN